MLQNIAMRQTGDSAVNWYIFRETVPLVVHNLADVSDGWSTSGTTVPRWTSHRNTSYGAPMAQSTRSDHSLRIIAVVAEQNGICHAGHGSDVFYECGVMAL